MNKICKDCGFLCWDVSHIADEWADTIRYDELPEVWRRKENLEKYTESGIFEDVNHSEINKVSCLRKQWIFGRPVILGDDTSYVGYESIFTPRNCTYYIKYQPGFTPEEHKELKREKDTNRTIRNATIIGAGIGATAAIVAQLLYALIARP